MRPLAFLLAIGLLAVPAACGGGEEEPEGRSPAQWTAAVCTAIGSWVEDVQARTQALTEQAGSISNAEQGRDLFVEYMDDLLARTDAAGEQIAAAGAPAASRGEEISIELRKTMDEIGAILAEARQAARELPVDDPARFQQQATELGSSTGRRIASAGQSFADRLGGDSPAELQDAFRDEPACERLA